jgi:hypothetical protein
MEGQLFHVLLDGKRVGPYDRRTILGMRVKKALLPGHQLLDAQGNRMTVEDLLGEVGTESPRTRPPAVGTLTFAATFRSVRGRGHDIPAFKGQVEVRVQSDVLRIAGRYRKGLGWREDRVKLPLDDVQHASAMGTDVDVALAGAQGGTFQWVTLTMDSEAAAREFAASLPARKPLPEGAAAAGEGLLAPLTALLRRK